MTLKESRLAKSQAEKSVLDKKKKPQSGSESGINLHRSRRGNFQKSVASACWMAHADRRFAVGLAG